MTIKAVGLAGLLLALSLPATAGELVRDEFHSATLGRSVRFTVYLPDGYREGSTRYPVLYLLHGAGGDEHSWTQGAGARETLDGAIRRQAMRPSIAVMPSFGPHGWYLGDAAKAFVDELIPLVETRYRASAERTGRSLGGMSMGGYGALNLALRHPDRFCGAALLSPAVYDPLPPQASSARTAPPFQRQGRFDPEAWQAHNHPALLPAYRAAPQRVAFWIASGDHDSLGIALASAQLYGALFQIQPRQVELRITDGDHETQTWRDALPEALRWVDAQCAATK